MNVATITVNPAVDETISVNHFKPGSVNRSQGYRYDAGGKGVNVASFLADCGIPVTVTGFLGEENSGVFERHFARKGIKDRFVRIPGETRVNIKIMDEASQVTTDLNMPGQVPGEYAIAKLLQQISEISEQCKYFVLSGNIQTGLPATFYAEMIHLLKLKNRIVLLDTSGDALREAIKVRPNVIKPNIHELRALFNQPLENIESVYQAALSLINDETWLVVVSMGKEGALFVQREQSLIARPPDVTVKSTVGAGDAMVAGLVAGIRQKMPLDECARLATAFSLSMITRLGRDLPEMKIIQEFQKQIETIPVLFASV